MSVSGKEREGAIVNVPKLSIRGPVSIGLAAAFLFGGVGLFMAQRVSLDQITTLDGQIILPADEAVIRSPRKGVIAKLYVSDGEVVRAGQLLARLDDRALRARIAKATDAAHAAREELATIRAKVRKALGASDETAADARRLVAMLADKIRQVERRARKLNRNVAEAETQISNGDIYADHAGRVELIRGIDAASAVAKDEPVLKLASTDDLLKVKVVPAHERDHGRRINKPVSIILFDRQGLANGPFEARRVPRPEPVHGGALQTSSGEAIIYTLIRPRSQIAKQIALHSGQRAKVLIKSGGRSVFAQLF